MCYSLIVPTRGALHYFNRIELKSSATVTGPGLDSNHFLPNEKAFWTHARNHHKPPDTWHEVHTPLATPPANCLEMHGATDV